MALAVPGGDTLATSEGYKFVEIVNLSGPLSEDAILRPASDKETDGLQANGEKGIVLGWADDGGKYAVETFTGYLLALPEANLKFIEAPSPEEGGFDAVWPLAPVTEASDMFVNKLVNSLKTKGWCSIQMFMSESDRTSVSGRAQDFTKWTVPKKEFESAYLGFQNNTKYAMVDDAYVDYYGAHDPLAKCDEDMTELGSMLSEISSAAFDFNIWGRMSALVRVPCSEEELEQIRPASLGEADYEDGKVVGHLNFLDRRKICMMYAIDNAGGELSFFAEDGTETRLPLSTRKLIVFRPDKLGYSYKPLGESTLLQAFFLSDPWLVDSDTPGVVEIPDQMEEQRVNVMAVQCHYPGNCEAVLTDFTAALCSSFDGFIKVPITRFDHSLYYDAHEKGKSYTEHGAFVDDKNLYMFDGVFWGISDEEVQSMSPSQRMILSTGFEVLINTGYRKEELNGQKIGTFVGDSSSDWTFSMAPKMEVSQFSLTGKSNAITAMRLNYALGMKGPCSTYDTACSSSLVAVANAHTFLRRNWEFQYKPVTNAGQLEQALGMGVNIMVDPHLYIGYSGAGMLAKMGRCFTFDKSAQGFARGEGCGAFHLVSSTMDGKGHPQDFLAVLVGSFMNQDGRSATMTAPNGPSQRDATIASLMESGFTADAVNTCECHGTGTALGDPIEVSALRNAIGHDHSSPLYFSSAKTNTGHQEANAGLAGLTKCVIMLTSCSSMPNNHLMCLNPHLDIHAFPAYFESDITDFETNTGLCGVSSFGSGGTNARGDVWAPARKGPRRVDTVWDPCEVHKKRSVFFQRLEDHGKPGPQSSDTFQLAGTWNAWTTLEEMKRTGEGTFTATITLGDTLSEQFHIVVNEETSEAIHPTVAKSGMDSPIIGPDLEGHGLNWFIDGKADQAVPGTVYRIDFEWNFDWERGETKKVSWKALSEVKPLPAFRHCYSIVGTWTSWKWGEMVQKDGSWTTSLRIGARGQEEFQIVRDHDWMQVLHPAAKHTFKTSVPIRGPDELGQGKHWVLRGPPGERLVITLKLIDGLFKLVVDSPTKGTKTWTSSEKEGWHDYYISGSWQNWGLSLMTPMPDRGKGVFHTMVTVGKERREEFKIVMDRDWELSLYPEVANSGPTDSMFGPDSWGHGLHWSIYGEEGAEYEVILDSNTGSLTWNLVS